MYDDPTALAGRPEGAGSATFVVRVESGSAMGRTLVLDGSQPTPVLVGEGPACELRLGDRLVSRRHASFDIEDGALRLRDLDSTNGTYVLGLRVLDVLLTGGEVIGLGASTLRVERGAPKEENLPMQDRFGRMLGGSREMRRLYPVLARLAASNVPVVIEGETGTGKELLAESIHEQSARCDQPYVVFDCTSVPLNLAESELFGHERGAFTGATNQRKGLFEQAHGGTLFIDEIGDLDPSLQPKLLRAIERQEIRRVGGNETRRVDVRILAATRRNLDEEVVAGRFRDDLYHRLMVTRIELPPLRNRRGDVPALIRRFWTDSNGEGEPPADLVSRWAAEKWPGNIRELRNSVARAVALGDLAGGMPPSLASGPSVSDGSGIIEEVIRQRLPITQARQKVIDAFEHRYLEQVLADNDGDTARAAAVSGVARRYFNVLRAKHR